MMKGIKIRLFPTDEQVVKLWQAIGTARWAWNWAVKLNQDTYAATGKILFEYDLKKEFTKVRNSGEYPWLKDVSAKVPATALLDLGTAYKQCFSKRKKGMTAGWPKFKKKGRSKDSYGLDAETVKFYEDGVQLQKVGHVKFKSNIPLTDLQQMKIYNPRITFSCGKWILSLTQEVDVPVTKLNEYSVGIDLGVKTLAVVSCDGKLYKAKNINRSHKVVRLTKQLKHKQRALARKQKGSANHRKALKDVQRCYQKITNIRKDHAHKVTRKIVDLKPKTIVMEDLNVQGMMKNRHLARAIGEQGFYRFRQYIEYKAAERGIAIRYADRFYPSSKTCSSCGHVEKDLKLSDRIYRCPVCGLVMDRDENAAKNLEKAV